jgi:hypothetical protein
MGEQHRAESVPGGNARFLISAAFVAGLICSAGVLESALGASPASIPDFAATNGIGWIASGSGFGTDFVQPPTGPGPVTNDPAHPYITNVAAAASGKQPTFRVADLTNPILQPWAVEKMRKANQDVLAGKALSPPMRDAFFRCSEFPLPRQSGALHSDAEEVLMIWQQDAQIRHVYLDRRIPRIRRCPGTANPFVL